MANLSLLSILLQLEKFLTLFKAKEMHLTHTAQKCPGPARLSIRLSSFNLIERCKS